VLDFLAQPADDQDVVVGADAGHEQVHDDRQLEVEPVVAQQPR
jgi:hypothetical protein